MENLTKALRKVKTYTGNNCHTLAIMEAARYNNDADNLAKLQEIEKAHLQLGYLPPDLYTRRHSIYQAVLGNMEKIHGPAIMQQFRSRM